MEPWGLGNKYGQWYLSGRDLDRGEQRLFRLSRIVGEVGVSARTTFVRRRTTTSEPTWTAWAPARSAKPSWTSRGGRHR